MTKTTHFGWFTLDVGAVYPLTIVAARYQGCYEGGRYLAFPCDPDAIPEGWDGGDMECAEWFAVADREPAWPIGRGSTPNAAHDDLRKRLTAVQPESDHP